MTDVYNPLDRISLAKSIEIEILSRPLMPLAGLPQIKGAGIYALYYAGEFDAYAPLSQSVVINVPRPIYVGKAIPSGGRIGGLSNPGTISTALLTRLRKHLNSIAVTDNLSAFDFLARYLVVDDIWIPLGENVLIERYRPVWNRVVSGFGNNPLGKGRKDQRVSLWDILHPGRESNVEENRRETTQEELTERVKKFLRGEHVPEVEISNTTDDDEAEND